MSDTELFMLFNVRVSSVLNRDVKQFGKQFMFDGDDETCWNSDQVGIYKLVCVKGTP